MKECTHFEALFFYTVLRGGFFIGEDMTVANNYNPIKQEGNGSTTSFSFDFPVITDKEIEVYQNIDGVESLVDSNNYTITLNTNGGTVNFNTAPAKGVVIAIVRVVDLTQEIPFLTSSGFPADRVEDCFDKLTMIAQQQQQVLDRCVKVVVTGNQTPEELLDEVYDKLDSATEIAEEAVDAANAATQAVESAEKTLREVTTYVDTSKSEINTLVTDATNNINSTVKTATTNIDNTINQAVEDVKAEAISAAEGAIQDAANTAIQIATDHANTVIIPPLQEYVDNARESATSAEESSLSASASALSASQSASNALASETNAKNSASEAALHNLKNKITNCITEIPQDIKLELKDGTLTLKAGSKVYNGNGLLLTKTSDSTSPNANYNGQVMLFMPANGDNVILTAFNGGTVSTLPAIETSYKAYYNTSDGKCYVDVGYWLEASFPIAIGTSTTESWVSIDQVFNGFGYIGSTVFVLPSVKGLIPNGRNADGSLKSIEFETSGVLPITFTETQDNVDLVLQGTTLWARNQTVVKSASEIGTATGNYYITDENRYVFSSAGVLSFQSRIVIGKFSLSSGRITSFRPKLPFRAVDYNELNNEVKKLELNMPTGAILPFTGQTAPKGFLICDGSAISRTTYASLFAIISTTYGAGDGSTTFNIPNYTNARFVTSGNISVMGNGKALGITDGTNRGVLYNGGGDSYHRVAMHPTNNGIGSNVGKTGLNMFSQFDGIAWGVVADASLSGIKGTASLASTCRFIIKY